MTMMGMTVCDDCFGDGEHGGVECRKCTGTGMQKKQPAPTDLDTLHGAALRRIAELEATLDVIRTECKRATDQVLFGRVLKSIANRANLALSK